MGNKGSGGSQTMVLRSLEPGRSVEAAPDLRKLALLRPFARIASLDAPWASRSRILTSPLEKRARSGLLRFVGICC